MMISYRFLLVLALFSAAATVATPVPTGSLSNEVSPLKDNSERVDVGANLPPKDKQVLQNMEKQRRGVPGPVRIGQGNADGKSFSAVPVQNYQNDAARLPVLENVQGTEGQGGDE